MSDKLLLKWGTVKAWDFETTECKAFELLKEYMEDAPMSCVTDHPDESRKKLLCRVIDEMDGEIQNDWAGEMMTKDEAKDYVMTYGN